MDTNTEQLKSETNARLHTAFYGPYTFRSLVPFDSSDLGNLTQLVESCEKRILTPLSGRSGTASGDLPKIGPVFIKPYRRGGVFKLLCKDLYLKLGPTRSEIELTMLEHVRSLGVNAPRAIATVSIGSLFYRTWLVMEEVPGARSLVEIMKEEREDLPEILKELSRQLKILITNRVHHIDFHPGNVVIGKNGQVYLVDFDKARVVKATEAELRDAYVRRWRRAVLKHTLSPTLSERIAFELRSVGYAHAD